MYLNILKITFLFFAIFYSLYLNNCHLKSLFSALKKIFISFSFQIYLNSSKKYFEELSLKHHFAS